MSQLIPLTKGQSAIVDDADYEVLSKFKWFAYWCHDTQSYYAGRKVPPRRGTVSMSRVIMNAQSGVLVDHHNHNTLDNRRLNLRFATHSQNNCNSRRYRNNTSGFKGVSLHKQTGKWKATIGINRRIIHIGLFTTPESAHDAYNKAAAELHGQFAFSGEVNR